MKLKLITSPETEPISLEEAKQKLKAEEEENDTISSLIKQAREWCEDYQGKKYITQTLEGYLDEFPHNDIEFRFCSPVKSIESIEYIDANGNENTIDPSIYIFDDISFVNRVVLAKNQQWPTTALKSVNGVKITFVAGYGNAEKVPETVKWAMILHMKLLYEDYKPEERNKIEEARNNLLGMRRVVPV